jgi:hypothetical protein
MATAVDDELMLIEDECLYTEKTHFEAEERLRALHVRLGLPATVLAVASAATLVGSWPVAAGILVLLAGLFSGAQTFLNPEALATRHHDSAVELARIRCEARMLLKIELPAGGVADVVSRLRNLRAEQAAVNKIAPGTKQKDYDSASKKIKSGLFERDKRPGEDIQ